MYTRRGVLLYLTQYLGRWGGDTIAVYAGEALKGQLARASATTTSSQGIAGTNPLDAKHLHTTINDLIRKALDDRAEEQATSAALQVVEEAPTGPGSLTLGPARQVQRIKGDRRVGWVHDVAIADACIPREAWMSNCAWRFGMAEHVILHDATTTCAR